MQAVAGAIVDGAAKGLLEGFIGVHERQEAKGRAGRRVYEHVDVGIRMRLVTRIGVF